MAEILLTDVDAGPVEATASLTDQWRRPSMRLALLGLALTCFGFVVSVSAAGSRDFGGALTKRLLLTGLGLGAFIVGATVPYRFWRRHSVGVLLLGFAVLVCAFIPGLGIAKNGAHRWISVGLPFGLQPSEFAKAALLIWTAAWCERHLGLMGGLVDGLLAPGAVIGAACVLILAEPDFGTAVLTGTVCMAVLLVMGARLIYLLLAAAAATPLMYAMVFNVPYRMRRVVAFLDPWADPQGKGYQLIQSLIAIGSGGVMGLGLGAGRQKEAFLPGASNDFVFSVVGEELGLIGAVALLLLFAWLLWEALRIVWRSRDAFAFALGLGLSLLLGLQTAAHVAVATGCVPTKGLSLPFISAGGSSLMVSLFAVGVLVNIAQAEEEPGEHCLVAWQDDVPAYERVVNGAAGGACAMLGRALRRLRPEEPR